MGAEREEGVLSLVVKEPQARVRRLPSLYFGNAQVFAHREVDEVMRRLGVMAAAIERIPTSPTYLVQACELDGNCGLYARDLFNRAPFRRKLVRQGLTFVDDPVVIREGSDFVCSDWGSFEPSFAVIYSPDESPVATYSTARLAAALASFHLGGLEGTEFAGLVKACRGMIAVGGDDPSAIIEEVRSSAGIG